MSNERHNDITNPFNNFGFVNISADVSEEEKKRHRSMIRSAAMKAYRKQHRNYRGGAQFACPLDGTQIQSQRNHVLRSADDNSSRSVTPLIHKDQMHAGAPVHEHSGHDVTGIEYLGAGRYDPFYPYPRSAGKDVDQLIDHSFSIMWPGHRPGNQAFRELAGGWHGNLRNSSLGLHAMLYGAAVHQDMLTPIHAPRAKIVRLNLKTMTMQLLREDISKTPSGSYVSDTALFAMVALSMNEMEKLSEIVSLPNPFPSKIPDLQWGRVYCSMHHAKEHTKALRMLLHKMGSLESIESPGTAEGIAFGDIVTASQDLCKPFAALLKHHITAADSVVLSKTPPRPAVRQLGQGFISLCGSILTEETISVYMQMADLTRMIDCNLDPMFPCSSYLNVIDTRCVVQHRLLSSRTREELSVDAVRNPDLYETTRCAALIYSAAVTFPMSPVIGVWPKLAEQILTSLSSRLVHPVQPYSYMNLILWILMLGSIASLATPFRATYIKYLVQVSQVSNLWTWEDVVSIFREFLWYDLVCEEGGRLVWAEVMVQRSLNEDVMTR